MLPHLLPQFPDVPPDALRPVAARSRPRLRTREFPRNSIAICWQSYGLDMTASYAGIPLRNPVGQGVGPALAEPSLGRGSGRRRPGLVVLKTVIAQDARARSAMSAWAIKESQMAVEPIKAPSPETKAGRSPGTAGAGGSRSKTTWISFAPRARSARERQAPRRSIDQIPPARARGDGLAHRRIPRHDSRDPRCLSTRAGQLPMPLEKDFSPTLAGSDRAASRRIGARLAQARARSDPRGGPDPGTGSSRPQALQQPRGRRFQRQLLAEVFRSPDPPDFSFMPIAYLIPIAFTKESEGSLTAGLT